MMRRTLGALALCGLFMSLAATPAAAHPLGNFTVNRAVAVIIGPTEVKVRYVVDMAEIPAFVEIERIDTDGDAKVAAAEGRTWATGACETARVALTMTLDGRSLPLTAAGPPSLAFPSGAGGLETLRLECTFGATDIVPGAHAIEVADATTDDRIGWREVTIAAGHGVQIRETSVPATSPSAQLTSYPADSLESPPDVRSGRAAFVTTDAAVTTPGSVTAAPAVRETAADALAGLLGPGTVPALGLLLAIALGMAHAASPGHGKTLVAAYLVGSRGSLRQAATLGLTVAVTHTLGVFVLGVAVLAAGEWIVPDRLIGWLSLVSGVVVVALGAGLLLRSRRPPPAHSHEHPHDHHHDHHEHHHPPHDHRAGAAHHRTVPGVLRGRELVALGFAGGLVPSASALIVLLVAVTSGRLLFGAALIVAFGLGMALLLAGLAIATTVIGRRIAERTGTRGGRLAAAIGPFVPLVSASAVLVAGVIVVIRTLPGLM